MTTFEVQISRPRGLILAAGRGTRFQTGEPMPKVLRPVLGKPMVAWVIETLRAARVDDITLVVGFLAREVMGALGDGFRYAVQEEQSGSGHAVACARDAFRGFDGPLVIMCGDSPLFGAETVRKMLAEHRSSGAAAVLTSASLADPSGYGRILRDQSGRITGIVEQKCATPEQRAISEVNGGAYVFDAGWLYRNIHLMARNEAGEYNLTDMIRVALEQGRTISTVQCDPDELLGVNSPEQLAVVEEILRGR